MEELGGARTHASTSGVAHFACKTEVECLHRIRDLMAFVPQNNAEDPPHRPTDDPADRGDEELLAVVPDNPNRPYDILDVIRRVVDDREFFEVHADYAGEIWWSASRTSAGTRSGSSRTSRRWLAGVLDIDASLKRRPLRPLL